MNAKEQPPQPNQSAPAKNNFPIESSSLLLDSKTPLSGVPYTPDPKSGELRMGFPLPTEFGKNPRPNIPYYSSKK